MSKTKLLIVEDDEGIRIQLKYALRDTFALSFAEDRTEARTRFQEDRPDLVSLDLGLPPSPDTAEEGLKALDEMLQLAPTTKVIVVTGNGDRENAVRAVQLGAVDYLSKPIDVGELTVVAERAAYLHSLEAEADRQLRDADAGVRFEEILGSTPKIRDIFAIASRVAKTDVTVLIQGESGTGKELLARAIHARSPRRNRAFIPMNCGAIAESLLESELFGHEKGAYTGAHIQRKGKIEVADGGTLFLDEIGEMSPALQVKLLRFLQEREVERIGGRERIKVDLRIIAATNKELTAEIQAGRFREDFFYRLSVVAVTLPPLRDRAEDIVLLANAFLARSAQEHRRRLRFSEEALRAILSHRWPGNIRELENRIQRAVILAHGRFIQPSDLDLEPLTPSPASVSLRDVRDNAERQALLDGLLKHRGNISRAAQELGVSRPTIHALLEKHAIDAKGYRR